MKEAFSTKVSPRRARWIKRQALAFGSVSTVIENAVGMVMWLIESGIVRWDLETLQRVNEENSWQEAKERTERLPGNESIPAGKKLLRCTKHSAEEPERANGVRAPVGGPLRFSSVSHRGMGLDRLVRVDAEVSAYRSPLFRPQIAARTA